MSNQDYKYIKNFRYSLSLSFDELQEQFNSDLRKLRIKGNCNISYGRTTEDILDETVSYRVKYNETED